MSEGTTTDGYTYDADDLLTVSYTIRPGKFLQLFTTPEIRTPW